MNQHNQPISARNIPEPASHKEISPAIAETAAALNAVCANQLGNSLLPGTLPQNLRQALPDLEKAREHYNWEILSKTIHGKERFIVLFGEEHLTSPDGVAAATSVLRHFKYQAREGVDFKKYWMPKLFSQALSRCYSELSASDPENYGCQGAMDLAATKETAKLKEAHRMVDDIFERLKSGADIEINPADYGLSHKECAPIIDALNDIIQRRWEPEKRTDSSLCPVVSFHLEANHKPGFRENLDMLVNSIVHSVVEHCESIVSVAMLSTLACGLSTAGLMLKASPVLIYPAVATGAVAGCLFGGLFVPVIPGLKNLAKWGVSYLGSHSCSARDRTMAGNLADIFDKESEAVQVLGQMGKAHVPGVSQLLQDSHGWTKICI